MSCSPSPSLSLSLVSILISSFSLAFGALFPLTVHPLTVHPLRFAFGSREFYLFRACKTLCCAGKRRKWRLREGDENAPLRMVVNTGSLLEGPLSAVNAKDSVERLDGKRWRERAHDNCT